MGARRDSEADGDGVLVDRVAEALADATLPEVAVDDPFTAGLVTDVRADAGAVTLVVSPAVAGDRADGAVDPETADAVVDRLRGAAFEVASVESVDVERDGDGTTVEEEPGHGDEHVRPDPAAERTLDGVDHVVAVASAKGGVGKTTVSVALARGLAAAGLDVGLFDADVYGPNVPELLDVEGPVRATDDGAAAPVERAGVEMMSVGLLADGGPVAWRGSMAHEALSELLFDTVWGHTLATDECEATPTADGDRAGDTLDVLVLDVPPGTGDVPLTITQSVPVDAAVLVSTPAATALSDTARFRELLDENGVPTLGVVRNMDGFTCPTCGDTHDLFDAGVDAGDRLDCSVLASLPFDADLRSSLAVAAGDDAGDDAADTGDGAGESNPDADLPAAAREVARVVRDRLAIDADPAIRASAVDVRGMPERPRREHVRAEAADADPGATLSVVADAPPDPLLDAVAAGFGCSTAALDPRVRRHGDGRWSLTVERPVASADRDGDAAGEQEADADRDPQGVAGS
ncbi:P-loop NTPase (plasmid) [Halobaculum sp. CBA1158]|uniref:P-loop NTPase n=1 Tax=Halobaculum sp. CBA1158 TaxID=2904243 RepID=UPI001F46A4C4|nr:P-loop NTPase [Halobaculum sp. CBA1158]UIP01438.1 P-loop NTPase [Halobaculum sp. CBA1158]